MNKFIIISHSRYAEGLYETLKFFKNDIDNVYYLNAYVENNEFEKDFRHLLKMIEYDNLIVLTDLKGGSVNQICTKLLKDYDYHLVSGINLPLALEMIFYFEDLNSQSIKELIEKAKAEIVYLNDLNKDFNSSDDEGFEL